MSDVSRFFPPSSSVRCVVPACLLWRPKKGEATTHLLPSEYTVQKAVVVCGGKPYRKFVNFICETVSHPGHSLTRGRAGGTASSITVSPEKEEEGFLLPIHRTLWQIRATVSAWRQKEFFFVSFFLGRVRRVTLLLVHPISDEPGEREFPRHQNCGFFGGAVASRKRKKEHHYPSAQRRILRKKCTIFCVSFFTLWCHRERRCAAAQDLD